MIPEDFFRRDLAAAIAYCAMWSVPVHFNRKGVCAHPAPAGSPPVHRCFFDANVTAFGGICIHQRAIYLRVHDWERDFVSQPKMPAHSLIHELAHVIDCDAGDWTPDGALELQGPMLAFEFYSQRYLRLGRYLKWMADFEIDGVLTWDKLPAKERTEYLERSLVKCRDLGILTAEGQPTFKRRQRAEASHGNP